jgi:glycosyltransferase involved in cell wall biosynthesis
MDAFAVSVIVPVYNAARFLACAVNSALQQAEVGEVVLVEDGSTDDSASVAEALCAAHPTRVFLHFHPGQAHRGPGESRNVGLRHARFPFVAFLDADDWYLPGYFACDGEAFARDPQLGMVRHPLGNGWDPSAADQRWFCDYTGHARAHAPFHSRVEGIKPENYFNSLYPIGDVSSGVADTLTIRRSLLEAVGGFPPRDWAEDTCLHLKLAAVGSVAFADMHAPLAMRRIHADNLSRRKAGDRPQRLDAMGQTLLELADFASAHRLSWSRRVALHKGWLRYAALFGKLRSYDMLRKWPWALLHPRIALAYALLYARMLARLLWTAARQTRRLAKR